MADAGFWSNAELSRDFFDNAELVQSLVNAPSGEKRSSRFVLCLPLYLPGEPVELQVVWQAAEPATKRLSRRKSLRFQNPNRPIAQR